MSFGIPALMVASFSGQAKLQSRAQLERWGHLGHAMRTPFGVAIVLLARAAIG